MEDTDTQSSSFPLVWCSSNEIKDDVAACSSEDPFGESSCSTTRVKINDSANDGSNSSLLSNVKSEPDSSEDENNCKGLVLPNIPVEVEIEEDDRKIKIEEEDFSYGVQVQDGLSYEDSLSASSPIKEEAMDSSGSSSESPSPILPKLKGRSTKQSKPKLLDPKPKKKAPQEKEVEEALDSIHHQHHSADEEEEEEEEGYDDEEEQPRVPRTKRTMEEEEEEEIHSGVEADSEEVQQPAKKKKGRGGGNKAGWSLPDVIEEELVEWLRSNSYLWLRSTKDYKRKKDAWQIKAEELNISVEHLQKWWKNLKDWYVKLLKKTSGQARKTLTGRDKWVLNSLSFYHSQMQVDVPDTLNTMARSGPTPSSSAHAALASRPLDEDDDEGMHILSDIESEEAQRAKDTKKKKPEWTERLIQHLQENQALLERVLLPQPSSLREAFIRYNTDVLRTVSDEEYQELQFSFEETMRRIVARRAGAVPPPQATTSTEPPQDSTSTAPTQASSSTTASKPTTSTTPSLHQMTPLTSLSRYLWSPSNYFGMDHPPLPQLQPNSPSQMSLTTPPEFTSQQEDFS